VDWLTEKMRQNNFTVSSMHGDMPQKVGGHPRTLPSLQSLHAHQSTAPWFLLGLCGLWQGLGLPVPRVTSSLPQRWLPSFVLYLPSGARCYYG
jgi:hypothetical protein